MTRDEVMSPNFVDHNIGPGYRDGSHREYYEQINAEFSAAFSDRHWTLNHLIAEGDMVVVHATNTWTHTGVYRGKPPTGEQITSTAITIYRFADGKIVESWDDIGLNKATEQLLAMPQ